MATADSERYDIYFAGECLEGRAVDDVRAAIGKLFKADDATLERLFSGQRQRIKRDCDKATALRYQKAIATAGGRAIVVPGAATATASEPATTVGDSAASEPATAAPEGSSDALSLAPAGSDVLRPEERAQTPSVDVDLSHLTVAEAGGDLGPKETAPPPPVPTPDFEVAATGADLGVPASEPSDAPPDTSAIELAPGEFDLSDCIPEPAPAPDVNLDHLSVADSGSDLLREDERRRDSTPAPDTSHLQLEQPDENS